MARKNASRSSETEPTTKPEDVKPEVKTIDLDAIERLAAEVDSINQQEEQGKKKRKPRTSTAASSPGATPETPAEPVFTPDPEFQFMVTHCTAGAIEQIKTRLDWTDPGLMWKEKVGYTVFKLINRIQPMGDSWLTDLATLGGYFALWSASNVLFEERPSPNPNPVRNDGDGKDVQNERTLGKGAEGFTL